MDIFDLSAKLTLDSSEYESGISKASSGASSFASKVGSGLKTAAKVGATAMAALVTAVTAVSAAFTKAITSTAAYGDEIDKNSQKLGISAQAYQEWAAVLEHSGTSIESMSGAFKTLAKAAQDATDDQVAAFERLGLSMEDVQSMSAEDLFSNVITGLQNMEEGTERTALAQQLLGRSAMELGALLNTSAEDTQAMIDRVNELGGVMSDDAVQASAKFTDSLQDMKTAFSGLTRNLTAEFIPALTEVTDGLTLLFSGNYDEGLEQIGKGIDDIVAKIGELTPQFMKIAGSLLSSLATAIAQNAPDIFEGAITLISTLGQGLIDNAPMLMESLMTAITTAFSSMATAENGESFVDGVVQLVTTLATTIAEAAPELIPAAVDLIIGLVEGLTNPENVTMLAEAAVALIVGLTQGLSAALPALLEAAPVIIENLGNALVQALPILVEGFATALWESIKGALDAIGGEGTADSIVAWFKGVPGAISTFFSETLPGVIDDIVNWFQQLPDKIKTWLDNTVEKFKTFVSDLWNSASEKIPQLVDDIISWFEELPSRIVEVGSNLVEGLWNGIQSGWTWLTGKVKEFVGNIVDTAKSVLGINSPSKVFMQIGEFVTEGFANGITDGMSDAIDAARTMAQEAIDAASIEPSYDWAYKTAAASSDAATSNSSRTNDVMEQIASLLTEIRDKPTDVYMDGEKMTSYFDSTLGLMSTRKARAYA